ncbi:putative thiazole-containing bacteriocin maturation protein [Bacillus sp. EB106-08-02-XG196]|uniref:putative thiazole-containing bacteriocin maturation protein n=1 Tax=Bacillus sp. EB106-08-02-XG196 TaxID=2737049 RepID=UPI0015C49442|nr:putative thiazole-containing bacteriocin maturation protein [Bacillus sp. EB106-08-02-XG196]NWQ42581.1 putative thiazole-containing bacteriocin maturation protein [Bacillus sp. EB106-08-02-XG196]
MTNMNPSMRMKVKRDTFFLPDPNSGVFFRNNVSSFRMEGSMIDQWVEKLIPMFNGEYTLEYLTNGLPVAYRDRVFEIAEALYRNGFVRDVSQDRPHQLKEQVLKKYASQIEFVDNLLDSGGFRFQNYRQAKVLAVGSGPFFVSLVASLLDSGLPKFQTLITDSVQTNRQRLSELVAHALKTDADVEIEEVTLNKDGESSWEEIVKPFDYILYVAEQCDVEELRLLHRVCREEKKVFLPAISLEQAGLAGPFVQPDSEACWESAWCRIHKSALFKDQKISTSSATPLAMLANVIVFELFKDVTGVSEKEQRNQFFLLDLETLEGNWHSFMPHPLVTGQTSSRLVEDIDMRLALETEREDQGKLLLTFNHLTSKVSGIFHIWEEGDLKQLPLAQCRVQPVNPLAYRPADLLGDIVCTGLTHEEARREAGLSGIEAYVSQLVGSLDLPLEVEVGTGETFSESVCRGLQRFLDEELIKQSLEEDYSVFPVQLSTVEDERCQYYLQALTTLRGAPTIGIGEEVFGFPVVWIGTNDGWYGSVDLDITMALRNALQQAIFNVQNEEEFVMARSLEVSSMILDEKVPLNIEIPACEERIQSENFLNAMEILGRNGKQLLVYELELEPFLKEGLAGIFGVLVQEEGLT